MERQAEGLPCLKAAGLRIGVLAVLVAQVALLGAAAAPARAQVEVDESTFGGLTARALGPAETGGRISAIEAVPDNPLTIYVGAADGPSGRDGPSGGDSRSGGDDRSGGDGRSGRLLPVEC